MKHRLWIALFCLFSLSLSCQVALAMRVLKDIPLDACVFLGQFDPKAASYVISARDKLLTAQNPAFFSAREVKSLDEATECDIAIRISQPDTWSVKADIFSILTKEIITSTEASGFFSANKIKYQIWSAIGEGTSLQNRLLQDRQSRLARLEAKKEASARQVVQPNKEDSTDAGAPIVRSDVDVLPPVIVRQNKNAYAIVIGIEQYRQKLPKADFAANDAKLMSEYLTKVMGYPEENVVTLVNDHAALGDFVKYYEKWLPNNAEKGSTVFVYYSGHGAPNPKTGDAYLVPYDGDPAFIAETGYSIKRMYDVLGRLPAKEIVVALDSCFSGAGGRSVIAKGMRPLVMNIQGSLALSRNITVLSASSGDQISATYDEKGHGLFTYFLLKGMKDEDVIRQDGSIKMDDLFNYIRPQVERIARKKYNNEQTPQLIGAKID